MSDDAAAPVPPVRLSQTTYLTADIVGLSNFYAELFDLEEVEEFRSEVFRGLRLGDVMLGFSALEAYDLLDIGDRRDPTGTGQYLTFEMPDDEAVNERVKAAEALGATVIKGPFTTYYHAWQCVLADPDDNVFRINCFH
ncbi:MAG: VOC family protein [Acidimicrobiales bacterium]